MTSHRADPAAELPEPPSGHQMATPGRTDMTALRAVHQAAGMMADVLLKDGDQICGFPAAQAGYAARTVDAWQWCSAGVLARELQASPAEARALLLAMEGGGYLTRHTGPLADSPEGAWLPGEEDNTEPLLLWHLTSPDGLQLAKAHIGSPISRAAAEVLLDGFLDRVRAVSRDPHATHVIESITLYGSLADPDWQEVTDVDLIAFTRRRHRGATGNGPADASGCSSASVPRWPSEDQALAERAALHALLRAGHDRLDITVVDELSDNQSPLLPGWIRKDVFP